MEDTWLLLHAENRIKDFHAWGTLYKADPQDWEDEDYATIACLAQQLLVEEQERYFEIRCEALRKRAANKEER